MRLIINEELSEKYPSLSFGILVAKKLDNTRKSTPLKQLFDGLRAQTLKQYKNKSPENEPKISNWRTVFKEIGGKTYKTCLESLLSSVLSGKDVPFTDNLSRIRDYYMVKWQAPVIGFSLDDIYGDIVLEYDKKSIFYRDQGDDLTKKWNSEQFKRGSFNLSTKNAVFIIENLGIFSDEALKMQLHELAQMVKKYCGGDEFEDDIVKFPRKEKDFGVTGLLEYESKNKKPVKPQTTAIIAIPQEIKEELYKERTGETGEAIQAAAPSGGPAPSDGPEPSDGLPGPVDRYTLKAKLTEVLKQAAQKAFPEADIQELAVEYPKDAEHGDYACSIALKLAKQLLKEPLKIAEEIIKNIEPVQFIGSVEAVLPGFINIKIAQGWMQIKVKDFAEEQQLYDNTYGGNSTVVIDFSAPNIAKPLGVHHLLSTIIGQALYNLYKALGYKIIGDNHLGDWGTQFGKLIYAYKHWGNKKIIEKDPVPELLKLYVKFHEEAEQDATLEDRAREEFKKMEEGNQENMELWTWFKELSIADLEKTYATLGIHFDEYIGESYYNDKMEPIIEEGLKKGVIKQGEGGALIVEFANTDLPPYMLKKSDGATLYSTRDLATIDYRIKRWDPQLIIYVVDMAQSLHFKQLFETAKMLGYQSARFEHVSFGRMRLPDRSMSTRKGNVILLEDLLKEGYERALKIVEEKSAELKKKEKENVARMVAIGSIKYNILSQNRLTDIMFDWDKMLSVEGNSAPYLQYSAARAESILRKYDEMNKDMNKQPRGRKKVEVDENSPQIDLFEAIENAGGINDGLKPFEHPTEQAVARDLLKFQEYLMLAADEFKPNILSNYLYELAQKFNNFYNSVSVLQAESKHVKLARLNIVKAVSRVLREGLKILGIEVPLRM
ncbi:arginine--tRNA ligase [Candidatus Peregrinibacteria bacterium]|nr:arginine--tRNA ligase [Candidatus Peregrinibacteria bacterium]